MKNKQKLWLVLPMRCLLFITAFSLCSMITRKDLTEITNCWSVIASLINGITIFVLWMICRRSGKSYREMIRYRKSEKNILHSVLFIVMMLLIGMGGMYLAVVNIFLLPLTTTIAEDGYYLGYGVNSFSSKWTAILIPAFFYALQHSFIPTIPDFRFMTYRFLSFLPLTLWICYQYRKGHSITYIMAGHWLLNVATTVQIAITSFYPEVYAILLENSR